MVNIEQNIIIRINTLPSTKSIINGYTKLNTNLLQKQVTNILQNI
jgi:hypothetical protein